jgi:hypothetical protein
MHSGNGLKSQFDTARPEQIGRPLVGLMQHILIAHHKMQQLQVLFQYFGMLDIPGYCYELAVPRGSRRGRSWARASGHFRLPLDAANAYAAGFHHRAICYAPGRCD